MLSGSAGLSDGWRNSEREDQWDMGFSDEMGYSECSSGEIGVQ